MSFGKKINISSRSTGRLDENQGIVDLQLQSYDIVANPGFGEAITNIQEVPTTDFSNFNLLPIARQMAARTIALDLVAVQPLPAPIGILRYIDYKYEDSEIWNTWKNHTFTVDEFFNDDSFDEY